MSVGWTVAAVVAIVAALSLDPAAPALALAGLQSPYRSAGVDSGGGSGRNGLFSGLASSDGTAAARVDAALANGTCVALFVASASGAGGASGKGSAWLLQSGAAHDAAGAAFESLRGEARVATVSV